MLVILGLGYLLLLAVPGVEAAWRGDALIEVPVRWCAVRGSPAVENPGGVGERDTDSVLWRRMERATEHIWLPEAGISFRSALTASLGHQASFPLIDDPDPPTADGTGGAGVEGDILAPNLDDSKSREINAAIASCEEAWEQLENKFDTNLEGLIGINLRRFVDKKGTPTILLGVGASLHTVPSGTDKCFVPPDLTDYEPVTTNDGWVAVVDNSFSLDTDPKESLLAHELGHALFLGHGNGLDDPTGDPPRKNHRFDGFCDRQEDVNAGPLSLMKPKPPLPETLTDLQKAKARAVAQVTAGEMTDYPGRNLPGKTVSDQRVDRVGEVTDKSIDIQSIGMTVNTASETTVFTHVLAGTIPSPPNHEFLLFADLDGDPNSGGAPSTLGFKTKFQGAELATRVEVRGRPEGASQPPKLTVWRFRSDAFVQVPEDSRIRADVAPTIERDTGRNAFDVVSLQLPNSVRGPAPGPVRLQAIARRFKGEVDRIPDAPAGGLPIRLSAPQYPICDVNPRTVAPGGIFTVEASGFVPNETAKILLGEDLVAAGPINSEGRLRLQARAPRHVSDGLHIVSVSEVGTGLDADCAVEIARAR